MPSWAWPFRHRRRYFHSSYPAEIVEHDQMQSILFSKLPFDVRYLIYKESLGGWIFDLYGGNAKTHPRLLTKSKITTCYRRGRDTVWHLKRDAVSAGKSHILALLKICQRVYASCPHLPVAPPLFYTKGWTTKRRLVKNQNVFFCFANYAHDFRLL